MYTRIRKRDGRIAEFNLQKVRDAVAKTVTAVAKTGVAVEYNAARFLSIFQKALDRDYKSTEIKNVDTSDKDIIDIEKVQDIVISSLKTARYEILADAYLEYRKQRSSVRNKRTPIMKKMVEITHEDSLNSDLKRENANIDSDTAMGTMLKYGSEVSKEFLLTNELPHYLSEPHINGDYHIHDLDFFHLTETCCQIDIKALLERGFSTGHGYLRCPGSINAAASLTCIAIQANQNDQHGGQSIFNLEYGLAPYVSKSFAKILAEKVCDIYFADKDNVEDLQAELKNDLISEWEINNELLTQERLDILKKYLYQKFGFDCSVALQRALTRTRRDTYQAMEALVHNLNTMNSRAGAQVPFSSVNFGTDTSPSGRMVSDCLLDAINAGLGNGETSIFPVAIFKVKNGINLQKNDPNYDLFHKACAVSAKRLFPNFAFIDAPFNLQYYKEGHPETEAAYMGCRTRVIGNTYDPTREIVAGRGNLSFTSINLPRLALQAVKDTNPQLPNYKEELLKVFYAGLDKILDLSVQELLFRFGIQCKKKVKNYPILMQQGVWIDSENLSPNDSVAEVLRHGTLSVGFIGLAECLKALIGKHHGEDAEAQKLGLEIIGYMRKRMDIESDKHKLNFSLLATPAEGLSGRFIRLDKKKFGIIEGITDRDYYTNSNHVPVYYPITVTKKIDIEAPYHPLTNAGHICYVELDGDLTKNVEAFERVIQYMAEKGIGYGSINHPVDRDPVCGYVGIIDDCCPRCGRKEGESMTEDMWNKLSRCNLPKKDYGIMSEVMTNEETINKLDI